MDLKNALDNVKWPKMWEMLLEMGTPRHVVQRIRQLYSADTAEMRVNILTDECWEATGVRQHLERERYSRTGMEALRYADDTPRIAKDEGKLRAIVERLQNQT